MICALLAAMCIDPPAMPPAMPVAERVRVQQWVRLGGVRLRPDRLVEDSRCPVNARCIWAGRAVVRVTIRDGEGARRINLTLGEPVDLANGRLALVAVSPEKMAGGPPKRQAPYRFTFEYRR